MSHTFLHVKRSNNNGFLHFIQVVEVPAHSLHSLEHGSHFFVSLLANYPFGQSGVHNLSSSLLNKSSGQTFTHFLSQMKYPSN